MMDPQRRSIVFNLGDFFFRWHSYLPLLLVPILCAAIATTQYRFASHSSDVIWEVGTLTLAVAGLVLRAWTVGVAAPGTSGRNTRRQKATTLNTTGPYSMIRHPLYLANWLIVLALALFPHSWLAAPVVASIAAGYYVCIAKREEAFLREQFGSRFEQWAERVPALIPQMSLYVPAQRAFDFKVVIRREFYGLAVILVTPLPIELVEYFIQHRALAVDPIWTVTAFVGAVSFALCWTLKKQGRLREAT
jgi:protein-S-isoprenylcysteine O-methyltransferase Ste14